MNLIKLNKINFTKFNKIDFNTDKLLLGFEWVKRCCTVDYYWSEFHYVTAVVSFVFEIKARHENPIGQIFSITPSFRTFSTKSSPRGAISNQCSNSYKHDVRGIDRWILYASSKMLLLNFTWQTFQRFKEIWYKWWYSINIL